MADALDDIRRALARPAEEVSAPRAAAVAAILGPDRQLWLVERARRVGDPWSGHLAFPGGKREPADADLLHTALRETWEEVGLDLGEAELLGRLDDLRSRPVRDLAVRPFVFATRTVPAFRPNAEVAGVLRVPLDDLLAGVGRGVMRWPVPVVGVPLPKVDLGGRALWGLTLRMVDDLLHRLDGRGTGLARPCLDGVVEVATLTPNG